MEDPRGFTKFTDYTLRTTTDCGHCIFETEDSEGKWAIKTIMIPYKSSPDDIIKQHVKFITDKHDNILPIPYFWVSEWKDCPFPYQIIEGRSYVALQMELMDCHLEWWCQTKGDSIDKSLASCLNMCQEIASVFHFLHVEKNQAYRSLKPKNILLKKVDHANLGPTRYTVKIADFAKSKTLSVDGNTTNSGEVGYKAPEQKSGVTRYGFEVDIFAMGLIFFEIYISALCPGINYADKENAKRKIAQLEPGRVQKSSEEFKKHCPEDIRRLIKNMTKYDPKKRPSVEEVLHVLDPSVSTSTLVPGSVTSSSSTLNSNRP